MRDFAQLAHEVFGGRMNGGALPPTHTAALARWLDALPRDVVTAPTDITAVARGRAVFEDPTVGCASCHGGRRLTNNQTVAVGTGEALQVPSLVGLAHRAPYMHTGCARDLRMRFTEPSCGGGEAHGHTAHLSAAQLDDLIAYLDAL